MTSRKTHIQSSPRLKRIAGALILVVIFLLLTWNAGRIGFASLLSAYAAKTYDVEAAAAAIGLNPGNPDNHFVRGGVLEARNDPAGAAVEYQAAAMARPDDCILWLSLARVSELSGDTEGALVAARRAVPLAPYYAPTHWQLGNILLRAGQMEEGFSELRLAGSSNPTLMPSIIDLAFRLSNGDPKFIQEALQPKTPEAYRQVGSYLRHFGDLSASLYIYNASGGQAPDSERLANITGLIKAKRFSEAYALWGAQRQGIAVGTMNNAGFEQEEDLQQSGFGWRAADNAQGFNLSLDTGNPKQGHYSLKVDFQGDSEPASPVIWQLVLVQPHSHYQLRFAARTEGLVSGGLPRITVSDANNDAVLGQSDLVPATSGGWRDYVFDFTSGDSTNAIQISLQRQNCASPRCPIFGHLWLDEVWLTKL